ncbi:hypothetical protein LPJ53_002087 [Coemansia erecta]|uniref:Uncharacterized protein n=1 Tax=Coemansia erecta TaxID=147472 RepID=A0A9W8CS62_9FUNG|nr:hypothetical protein LPJ53_002087 [Coemansia erecta]
MVICQDTRYLQQNRKIARKRLTEKLDLLFNGEQSKAGKKIQKLQARKHKQRQRSKKKYGGVSEEADKHEASEATEKQEVESCKPE